MIIVDNQEGSKDFYPVVCSYCPDDASISISCSRLAAGDILFIGKGPEGLIPLGIEFKSISDYLSSLDNGRLQRQLFDDMEPLYPISYLLVYGEYRQYRGALQIREHGKWTNRGWQYSGERAMPWSALMLSIMELQLGGIIVQFVETIEDAAVWVISLYRWWQESFASHSLLRKIDKSHQAGLKALVRQSLGNRASFGSKRRDMTKTGVYRTAAMALEQPAIGTKKAWAVGKHFKTPHRMVNATVEEWKQVVGPVTAESVYRSLREE